MYKSKKIVQPRHLEEGDKVALISPAYWVPQETLKQAVGILRDWGLQPVVGANTSKVNASAYAGTAEERVADLHWALEDDSVRAIVCAQGGYGTIHLLNRIPLSCFHEHPKWIIGNGDVTMLLHASVCAGVACVHGPMAYQMAGGQGLATDILRETLFGTIPQYEIPANPYNHCGHGEGILVGGNLTSFSAIVSARFPLPPEQDVILYFEESEKSLHYIDRLICSLRLSLDFERVKGIIFGSFSSTQFDLQFDSVEQMLTAHLREYDIPVCCGFPVGSHSCIPLLLGAPCSLDVTTERSALAFNVEGERRNYIMEEDVLPLFK